MRSRHLASHRRRGHVRVVTMYARCGRVGLRRATGIADSDLPLATHAAEQRALDEHFNFARGDGRRHAELSPNRQAFADCIGNVGLRFALSLTLADTPRNRRAFRNVGAVFVLVDAHEEFHAASHFSGVARPTRDRQLRICRRQPRAHGERSASISERCLQEPLRFSLPKLREAYAAVGERPGSGRCLNDKSPINDKPPCQPLPPMSMLTDMERNCAVRNSQWVLPVLLATFASTPYAQEPRTAHASGAVAAIPEFEVASVKPTDLHGEVIVGTSVFPGGRVRISGCPLEGLIRIAFHLTDERISGGAPWTEQTMYEVEALPPKTAAIKDFRYGLWEIADERLRQMVQSLLIDRFQLRFHQETKTADVYLLRLGGLRPAFHPTDAAPSVAGRVNIRWGERQWTLRAATMAQLAEALSQRGLGGVPVLNRTGLGGRFDYAPENADPNAPDPNVDAASSALNFVRQLHLKLQRAKGPVKLFVIDHAEKPSPN